MSDQVQNVGDSPVAGTSGTRRINYKRPRRLFSSSDSDSDDEDTCPPLSPKRRRDFSDQRLDYLQKQAGDVSIFRILAPEFVCPNDEDSVIEKPENTIITIKTDAANLQLRWDVRWVHLNSPSQRYTLLLWKTVRALEAKLNAPQPEPFVYVIDNSELIKGVEYLFNVTASDQCSDNRTTKTFTIDHMNGDSTLLIDGRSQKLSVLLIGGEAIYVDMENIIDAIITTCSPTKDYYFVWSIESSFASPPNITGTSGSRLEIPPYSLQSGASYYVTCAVYRNNGEFVTQTGLPLQVLFRGLAVGLSLDALVVTANQEFEITALVENYDHFDEKIIFVWSCNYENEPCVFENVDNETMSFPIGLPRLGRYEMTVFVSVKDQQASSKATVTVIDTTLPVIQIKPQHRWVNANSMITLVANASNVAPSCTLTWYFASKEYLDSLDHDGCETEDCLNGEELAGSVTITSLEETFLNELTDFTNETEWRQVVAHTKASSGRARLVARCGCSLTFNCDTKGMVHADVNFVLNESPNVAEIKVSPESGTAMETVFRLSTLSASDPDKPLRYSFYCRLNANETLKLASYMEHLAHETFLPFIDAAGTKVWVEVCDSLGACSTSESRTVQLLEGEGRTMPVLMESITGHASRCEMMRLRVVVQCAASTYINADQQKMLSKFTTALMEILTIIDKNCIKNNQEYSKLLDWLIEAGIDTDSLIE